MTRWRSVVGYPDYLVSDDGQVCGPQKLLSPSDRNRYPSVMLYRDKKPVRYSVHILMLEAFVGPRPPGYDGMHDDDVSTNNVLSNLSWGTRQKNISQRKHARGERQGASVLTEQQVLEMRELKKHHTTEEIAERYGVHPTTAARAINGKTWSHL